MQRSVRIMIQVILFITKHNIMQLAQTIGNDSCADCIYVSLTYMEVKYLDLLIQHRYI